MPIKNQNPRCHELCEKHNNYPFGCILNRRRRFFVFLDAENPLHLSLPPLPSSPEKNRVIRRDELSETGRAPECGGKGATKREKKPQRKNLLSLERSLKRISMPMPWIFLGSFIRKERRKTEANIFPCIRFYLSRNLTPIPLDDFYNRLIIFLTRHHLVIAFYILALGNV